MATAELNDFTNPGAAVYEKAASILPQRADIVGKAESLQNAIRVLRPSEAESAIITAAILLPDILTQLLEAIKALS